jgi:UDP-N-acetylenolpyruvoylglucosamine reductase
MYASGSDERLFPFYLKWVETGLMGIDLEENKPLAPFTTFGIGGPARWFVEATSEEQIAEATAWAREKALPLFVLGGGSNLLVSDAGFDGLVLRIAMRGVDATTSDGRALYRVAAGEDWDRFVHNRQGPRLCARHRALR